MLKNVNFLVLSRIVQGGFAGVLLLSSISGARADQKSEILIAKMKAAYKELKSYQAEFTREISPSNPDTLRIATPGKGTVFLAKPDRVAVQFIPNGSENIWKSVWNGKTGYKQASGKSYMKLNSDLGGVQVFVGDFAPIVAFFNLEMFGTKEESPFKLGVKNYLGIATVNGVKCNAIRATSKINEEISLTIWLNPITNRIVKQVQVIGKLSDICTVTREIQGAVDEKAFDITIPDGLISLEDELKKMNEPEKLVPQAIKSPKAEALLAETIATYKALKSLGGDYSTSAKFQGKKTESAGSFMLGEKNLILRQQKAPEERTYFSDGDKVFVWSKGSDTIVRAGNFKEKLNDAIDGMEALLFFFGEERMKANEPALMNARPTLEPGVKLDGIEADVLKFDYQDRQNRTLYLFLSHDSRLILKVIITGVAFGEKVEQIVSYRNVKANPAIEKGVLTFEKVFPKGLKIEDSAL